MLPPDGGTDALLSAPVISRLTFNSNKILWRVSVRNVLNMEHSQQTILTSTWHIRARTLV